MDNKKIKDQRDCCGHKNAYLLNYQEENVCHRPSAVTPCCVSLEMQISLLGLPGWGAARFETSLTVYLETKYVR